MEEVLMAQEFVQSICRFLCLRDLESAKCVSRYFYRCLADDHFWNQKLLTDFNVTNKHSNQSWKERYKLALAMGQISIFRGRPRTSNENWLDRSNSCFPALNIRAIKAKMGWSTLCLGGTD